MRIVWRYLLGQRWLIALALALAGASQVLALVDPIIFGKIVDDYVQHPGTRGEAELTRGVLGWLAIAVAVAVASRLLRTLSDYVSRMVTQRFGVQIFNDGLRHAMRLSFEEYEELRSGETLALLQKVRTETERFVTSLVNVLFVSVVGVLFLVWFALTRHWALVPVFVVGVLVVGGLAGLLGQRIKLLQRSIVRETARMAGAATESLRNIELVRTLGLGRQEVERLRAHTEEIFRLEMQKVRKARTLAFLQGSALSVLKQSILFALLWLIFHRVLATGELIAMQFISVQVLGPLQEIGNVILFYREAEGSLIALDNFLKRPVAERPEEPVAIGALEEVRVEGVTFRHRTASQPALDGVSFAARLGDTLAFVGPSGSGKSTLVKLLVGLYRPAAGRLLWNGIDATDIRQVELRRQLGIVTQETQLFSGTIRDNLRFVAPQATDEEMLAALRGAAVHSLVTRSPLGLDAVLGEGGIRLSGGERQRLAIARALIRKPRLLILDEATAALDSLTEEEIASTLRDLSQRRERIVITIAHRLSTVRHADTIHVLERGRIVESGTHDELLGARGLYYAMWRQQIGERERTGHEEGRPGDSAAVAL